MGHIQALTTAHSGLRVVLENGLGEVRPCRTSQQQGRRNVLTPGGELGRAMPWYRSGVLCNSQTSRRPVGDTVDSPTDSLKWSVTQVASCRLLHSGDSLAAANTAASSGELSLFQGTQVMAAGHSCFPCSSRARHR